MSAQETVSGSSRIIRGGIREEIFERMGYAGNVLHSMDVKFDRMLDNQDQTLQIARETKEEIVGLRSDTGSTSMTSSGISEGSSSPSRRGLPGQASRSEALSPSRINYP